MRVTNRSYCLSMEGKETGITVCLLGSSSFVYHHSAREHLSADTEFSAVLGGGHINNSKIPPLPSVLTFP